MIVGIATFSDFVESSRNRITCENGGSGALVGQVGEVGCWCVTFFALFDLLVVEAV